MRMTLAWRCAESERELRRRARVLAYRLMQGEMVRFDPYDRAWDYVHEGIRVPEGSAVVPEWL